MKGKYQASDPFCMTTGQQEGLLQQTVGRGGRQERNASETVICFAGINRARLCTLMWTQRN
ncbi:hypothetical protein RC95_01630 [Pectobacterium brasiliense]|nr:hypothetical protein RC95_01630 [Pectobacterium brasiliense]